MKRLISFWMMIVMLSIASLSFAEDTKTWLQRLPGGKLMLPYYSYLAADRTYFGINPSTPLIACMPMHESWTNPAAASSCSIISVAIATATLVGAGTTFCEVIWGGTQWYPPRTIAFSFTGQDTGDTIVVSTCWIRGLATVTGITAKGQIATEVVISTAITVTYSNNAFARILTCNVKITANAPKIGVMTDLKLNIGTGVKIGLRGDLPAATTDFILAVKENATAISPLSMPALFDATYDTYDGATDPDGNSREIYYLGNTVETGK